VAVIELDLDAPPPVPARTRPPLRALRPAALVAVALLTLVLTGAAPVTNTLWRPIGFVPLSDEDSRFAVEGGRLYTIDSRAGQPREVTAVDLTSGDTIWRYTTAYERRNGGDVLYTRPNLTTAGDQLLVQGTDFATSVLDAATGEVRWSTPVRPEPLGGGHGLIQETTFRKGTDYDLRSGDAGLLYWGSDGRPHTEPPLRTVMSGVDMRTGQRQWTTPIPGAVWTGTVGDGLLVVAYRKLMVLQLDGGAVLRERDMPAGWGDDISFVELSGDLLLVNATDGTLTGYDVTTLQPLWSRPAPTKGELLEGGCVGLPCRVGAGGVAVLDPVTGEPAWRTGRDTRLDRRGDLVIESQPRSNQALALRDLTTGTIRVPLDSWNGPMAASTADQPLVVTRTEGDDRTAFGVLRPGDTAVQPLGDAEGVLLECVSADRYVVCRVPGGIRAWAYRA
jgi:hypothetical protein